MKNHQNSAKLRKSNNLKLFKSKKMILDKSEILINLAVATNTDATRYLIAKARIGFIHLKQAFTKALILRHFDLEYQIRIETNTSGNIIGRVLSQLNFNWVAPDNSNLAKFDLS